MNLLDELKAIVGEENVLHDPVDLSVYECDAETLDLSLPDYVVLPASTKEVSLVMKLAHKYQIPVSPRGAGTGLSGGATPVHGGISLVLTRMTRILQIDPYEQTATVQPGCTNASVSEASKQYNLHFAPDPSSGIASTIGGNIAENAGGPHCLKYGMTTNHVLGATVVLSDGSIAKFNNWYQSPDVDLLGLVVGSEGTMVIVTEAILKLTPNSQSIQTLLAYFPTVSHCSKAVSAIVSTGVIPSAMELVDQITLNAVEDYLHMGLDRSAAALLIVELDGMEERIAIERKLVEEQIRRHKATSLEWATNAYERMKIWKARKSAFGALGRVTPHGYVLDGVVPRSRLAEAIELIDKIGEKWNLQIANVAHAGDGNLHPCLLYNRENKEQVARVIKAGQEILHVCVQVGGTLSGEHGIGVEKIHDMPYVFSDEDMALMLKVRDVFDPASIMNPGKVIPAPKRCGESGDRPLLRHQILSGC